MSQTEKWTCRACGQECPACRVNEPKTPCERCGGVDRHIELNFSDVVVFKAHDWLDAKLKNANVPSKKKLRRHLQMGSQWSVFRGKFVKKIRDLNKDANTYLEHVVDPDTGEVIHRCEEPLSAHVNHGTAKTEDA